MPMTNGGIIPPAIKRTVLACAVAFAMSAVCSSHNGMTTAVSGAQAGSSAMTPAVADPPWNAPMDPPWT